MDYSHLDMAPCFLDIESACLDIDLLISRYRLLLSRYRPLASRYRPLLSRYRPWLSRYRLLFSRYGLLSRASTRKDVNSNKFLRKVGKYQQIYRKFCVVHLKAAACLTGTCPCAAAWRSSARDSYLAAAGAAQGRGPCSVV